ncbi:MAG: HAMP domain-containing protein [Paracoccaceae bacterium]
MNGGPASTLFRKYFAWIFIGVMLPLLCLTGIEALFAIRDRKAAIDALLRSEAASASGQVQAFLSSLRESLSSTVQQPWSEVSQDQHKLDGIGFLRRTEAAGSILLADSGGREQVFLSRVDLNRFGSGTDLNRDPAVAASRKQSFWFGDMEYSAQSEPKMKLAVAGERKGAGFAIAEIDLKAIREVISAIRIGTTGHAMIVNTSGQLIAHPDMIRVLSGNSYLSEMRAFARPFSEPDRVISTIDIDGTPVLATMAEPVPDANWRIFALQSRAEAMAPVRAMLVRSAAVNLAAAGMAVLLAYFLSRRITHPIRRLEEGATQIGTGQFGFRIAASGNDEIGRLGLAFNEMAGKLGDLQSRSDRLAGLKRFLPAQVAELLENTGTESALSTQRAEIVVVFCDLRGFTGFTARSEPELIMEVLGDYYQALGSVITRYEATLTNFAADGLMVLVNAPIPCPDPAGHALRMSVEMQAAVQGLLGGWNNRGCELGFGIGVAMGWATVGRIGYEGRLDYTAIGGVVNLASRLCGAADDRQILFDRSVAHAVRDTLAVAPAGARKLKGFDRPVPVFTVSTPAPPPPGQPTTLNPGP